MTESFADLDEQPLELRDAWMGMAAWHVRELEEAVEAAAIKATRAAREPRGKTTEIADEQIRMTVEGSRSEVQEFLISLIVSPWTTAGSLDRALHGDGGGESDDSTPPGCADA